MTCEQERTVITISTMDVHSNIGELLDKIALRGDEYLVTRKGKPLAVMMPVEKAESIRRAARMCLDELLERPNLLETDPEAMDLANAAVKESRAK